tara:strand:- start:18638 stop:19528 length:891 start_codon:yes stop_codon:yes gene_type:complete
MTCCTLLFPKSKTVAWTGLLFLLAADYALAASNEDLLQIIQKLESRIEQLESQAGRTERKAEPEPAFESTDSDYEIPTTPAPVQPLELIPGPPPTPISDELEVSEAVQVPAKTEVQEIAGEQAAAELRALEDWALFLNIGVEQPDKDVSPIVWENVEKSFRVLDILGRVRTLDVAISMEGEGERKKIGRSLLFRPHYGFDFQYKIDYSIKLDGKRLMSAQKYLSSTTLSLDKSGRLPLRITNGKETQFEEAYSELALNVHFGCEKPAVWDHTNMVEQDPSFKHLNTYACLLLDFGE